MNDETIDEFEKAIVIYRGDFFQDKNYQWCIAERLRLQKYYLEIIKKMALYFVDKQEYKKAEETLYIGISKLPLEEDLHELLLKTFFLQNSRVIMIRHYEYLEKLLQEELGVEVRPDTKRLYDRLLNS